MSEANETDFVGGLIAKKPHASAPRFCLARLSMKRQELIAWLSARNEDWINVDIKESRGGKWYAVVDSWKPDAAKAASAAAAG